MTILVEKASLICGNKIIGFIVKTTIFLSMIEKISLRKIHSLLFLVTPWKSIQLNIFLNRKILLALEGEIAIKKSQNIRFRVQYIFTPGAINSKMMKILAIFLLIASCNCMKWSAWSVEKGDLPSNAVLAGTENEEKVYVIRASHADGLYPGKFMPELKKAFVTYNRKDIPATKFEVSQRKFGIKIDFEILSSLRFSQTTAT